MEITLTKSNVKATIVLNANAVFSPEKSFPDSLLSGNCDSLILERSGTRILPSEIGINGFDQYFSQNIEATNLPTQTFKDLYNALEG